jgi:FkbM family methyltransferase
MTFISYAQNFEDVMLWRALKHVLHGFYIDVGACSPNMHSVTRAFYDHGWRGINIELNHDFFVQLKVHRQRDINLEIALGAENRNFDMNFFPGTGLSTLNETVAEKHIHSGWIFDKQTVEVSTLTSLCDQYIPKGQDVHFLKVDVEGFEEDVLKGNDWTKYRPWVVVVEATMPTSQQENYDLWEPIILNACYRFAYADGLNRFYVADEHAELLPAFKYPPNVFDDFKLNTLQEAEDQGQSMQASYSWRITAPLRKTFGLFIRAKAPIAGISRILRCSIGAITSPILSGLISVAIANPSLKALAISVVNRYPRINEWLYYFVRSRGLMGAIPSQLSNQIPSQLSDLSQYSRRIYADLKAAIESQNVDGH